MNVGEFSFQRLAPQDISQLWEWMNRRHVDEWWQEASSLEAVGEKYLPRTGEGPVKGYLAIRDARPLGYVQSWVAKDEGEWWWQPEEDPGVLGIDQFLSNESDLGQGVGTAMVRSFVAMLFADPAVTRVQLDVDPANGRALRCYEKSGFRRCGEVETPGGPLVLMRVER